jgi:two-component system, OmpR family, response regulator
MRILVIEDDSAAAEYVAKGLREAGHTPDLANNGRDGLFLATTEIYDLVILDRMLPKMDGLTILRTLRASEISTPVLVLSALGDVDERVAGLQAGGDDYLSKPYAFAELLARAEALFRRRVGEAPTTQLCVGDLSMDLLARKVVRGDTEIELQPREYTLLELLMRHAGQVVTRTMMLEKVWGYHFDPQTNVIDVHVSRLRTKIDKDFSEPLLKTVRGAGYMLRAG